MKHLHIIYFILLLTITPFFNSYAKIIKTTDEVIYLQDLPNTSNFLNENNKFVNLGYKYSQFRIFNIPLWNYGMSYCTIRESPNRSANRYSIDKNITDEEANAYVQKANISLPDKPELGFYDRFGGKLILVGIILLIYFLRLMFSKPAKKTE